MKHISLRVLFGILFYTLLVSKGSANPAQKNKTAPAASVCKFIRLASHAWDVPNAFLAKLLWKESRFNPNAVSHKGAEGIAQFMPATARQRGLADPFEPKTAILASARYLSELKVRFGNWGLAAAAYNAGENRIVRWRSGKSGLPYETEDYVLSITGHTADEWDRNVDMKVTFSLDPKRSFTEACTQLRTIFSPRMVLAPRLPWGVLIAANFSRTIALRQFSRVQRKHTGILSRHKPTVFRRVNLSMGYRAMFNVQVGVRKRADGISLCARLRRAKGSCIVIKN